MMAFVRTDRYDRQLLYMLLKQRGAMSTSDIARSMGVSSSRVHQLLQQAQSVGEVTNNNGKWEGRKKP